MWREILKAFNPLADEDELDDDVNYRTELYNMLRESDFLNAVRDLEDEGMRFYAKLGENYKIHQYLFNSLWGYVGRRDLYATNSVFRNTNPVENDYLKKGLKTLKNDSEKERNITEDIPFYYIYNAVNRIFAYLADVVHTGQTHRPRNVRGGFKPEQLPEIKPFPQSFNQLLEKVRESSETLREEIDVLIRQYAKDVGKELNENFYFNIFKMVDVRDVRDFAYIDNLEQVTDMWVHFLEETHEEENDKRILDEIYSNARKGIFKYEIDEELGVPHYAVSEHLVSLRKDDVKFQDEVDYQTRLEGILNGTYSGFRKLLLNKFKKESDTIKEKWSTPLYYMIYNSSNRWKDLLKAFNPIDETLDEEVNTELEDEDLLVLKKAYIIKLENIVKESSIYKMMYQKFYLRWETDNLHERFINNIINGGYIGLGLFELKLKKDLPKPDIERNGIPFSRTFRNIGKVYKDFWKSYSSRDGVIIFNSVSEEYGVRSSTRAINFNEYNVGRLETAEKFYKLMDEYDADVKKLRGE